MDETDFRILARLIRDPFASRRALGDAVDMSGMGVQGRLDRLAASGVLGGFVALPSAGALGRCLHMWDYPEPAAAPDPRRVLDVEDVAWAVEWHDASWRVHAYRPRADAAPPSGLDAVMGAPGVLVEGSDKEAGRDPRRELSPLDWRLIEALMQDPRASAADLARASGLSAKLVRKRRALLVARGDVQVVPLVSYAAARGLVLYTMSVTAEGAMPAAVAETVRPFGELLRATEDPPTAYYVCRAIAFQEVATQVKLVRQVPGVRRVEPRFPRRRVFAHARLAGWARARREAWEAARPRRARTDDGAEEA